MHLQQHDRDVYDVMGHAHVVADHMVCSLQTPPSVRRGAVKGGCYLLTNPKHILKQTGTG